MDSNNVLYYQPKIPNLGDHLNSWLWEKVKNDNSLDFGKNKKIGIGSILTKEFINEHHLDHEKVMILGSGVRGMHNTPNLEFSKSSFFRGPFSSLLMSHTTDRFISDGAYFIRNTQFCKDNLLNRKKKFKVSVIPYFRTFDLLNWNSVGQEFGINIINPRIPNGIEDTLTEIAESEFIIAEAMHGAILADALRVPWIRLDFLASVFEGIHVSEFKWKDWQFSVDLPDAPTIRVGTKTQLASVAPFNYKKQILKLSKNKFTALLKQTLSNHAFNESNYIMSSKMVIDRIDHQLTSFLKEAF